MAHLPLSSLQYTTAYKRQQAMSHLKKQLALFFSPNKFPLRFTMLNFSQFLLILIFSCPFLVISQSSSSEQEILLSIKKHWDDQPPLNSWVATPSHCHWPGIHCTNDGSVTGISLPNQNISGEFPASICDLKNLSTLDLACNYLGGEFPTVLYKCTKLQKLNLSYNLFVGRLPYDINNLSPNLQDLNLSYNNFSGDIPSSIGQLQGLTTLYMQWNSFNGLFPSELGSLGNLEELFLAYNSFSPVELPEEFGKLKSVRFMWMTQCNLIGRVPESFGNLDSLEHLDLALNNLEGGIPSGLFLLKNLRVLYLYGNGLSGEIPSQIEAFKLEEIDLSENNLTGPIPQSVSSLKRLSLLNLFDNHFYGVVPQDIALIRSLKTLKLFNNSFTGPLPPELGLHSRLESFEVCDNEFTGQLPENLCSGGLLKDVVASNNQLHGSIPKSLGQCNSLLTVQFYNNHLSGDVPEGLWMLQNMSKLLLYNNQLSGKLPSMLARNITHIEISNNRFTGEITASSMYWQSLQEFKASNNLLSGNIPLELTSLSGLNSLILEGNQLTGELPSEIISWVGLHSLDLSRNMLSGPIPSALGLLPSLNSLDLSNNRFSGKIPPQFSQLKLSALNLSSNRLTGGLPDGYDNAAYQNSFLNTDLCSVTGDVHLPQCKIHRGNAQYFSSKFLILVFAFLAFVAVVYFSWFIIRELQKRMHDQDTSSVTLKSFHKLDFKEDTILCNRTEANLIGYGGSGKVYRIPLDGPVKALAVKSIRSNKVKNEKEFIAEVDVLGSIRHCNIVKLWCCIIDRDSKNLVYEYMENQSLHKWIHRQRQRPVSLMDGLENPEILDWPSRLKVAIGAAQGLSYMHHDCSPPIIHRDVKSSNILLDSEFNAKIADFGLARILAKHGVTTETVSAVRGSFGYMAPEYCYTKKVNEKIDVYSFGVVLLELVTGKEPHTGDEYSNLADWSWRHYSIGLPIVDALDEEVDKDYYLDQMSNVFMLGLHCTSTLASSRPSMKDVLQVLQRVISVEDYGGPKVKHDVAPLLGSESYHVSSCKDSMKKTTENDEVYGIV